MPTARRRLADVAWLDQKMQLGFLRRKVARAEDWPLKQNIEQGYRVLRMGNADDFLSETSGSAAARGTRSKPAKNSTRAQRFRPQLN